MPLLPDVTAPDGSDVRLLCTLGGGSMAHFSLGAGDTSLAVAHHGVEEIWYILAGTGEMWREQQGRSEVTLLQPGLSLTIPKGTSFQFRATGSQPLTAVAITMPPWPGADAAVPVRGFWP